MTMSGTAYQIAQEERCLAGRIARGAPKAMIENSKARLAALRNPRPPTLAAPARNSTGLTGKQVTVLLLFGLALIAILRLMTLGGGSRR
jgi:hypothetical protein